MAITINSRFKPFSFAELLLPYQIYGEAYKELEKAYTDLLTLANTVEAMANKQQDPVAYKTYKDYSDALRASADKMATEGLSPASRQAITQMLARYATDITPILQAYKTRAELIKALLEALIKDPTHMFARQASSISLDDYLRDKLLDAISLNYSGALLTQLVALLAQALAKELKSYGRGKPIDAYTNTFLKLHGFTSGQVLEAINNPNREESLPILNAIVESTISSSGIKGWNDEAMLGKAYDYARHGLWSAVGLTDITPMENYGAREALRHSNAMNEATLANPNLTLNPTIIGYDPNASPLYSKSEVAEMNQKISDKIKEFLKLGLLNKNGQLTLKGMLEYNNTMPYSRHLTTGAYRGDELPVTAGVNTEQFYLGVTKSPFRKFIDSLGYNPTKLGSNMSNINTLLANTISDLRSGEKPIGALNIDTYRIPVDNTLSLNLANIMSALIGVGHIHSIGKVKENPNKGKQGEFPAIIDKGGELLTGADFREKVKNNPIVFIENAPAANQLMVLLADGSRYLIPEGVYSTMAKLLITSSNLGAVLANTPTEAYVNINRSLAYGATPTYGTKLTDIDRGGETVTLPW